MTPYRDYAHLGDATEFERLRVMATASFLLAGGTLEKSLAGSFNIHAKDMILMGNQWAFEDPEADGLYFIATDTDASKRGSLGWGMVNANSDGVKGLVQFKYYVDPMLVHDIARLEEQVSLQAHEGKKLAADLHRSWGGVGAGGLGYRYTERQKDYDDMSYNLETELRCRTSLHIGRTFSVSQLIGFRADCRRIYGGHERIGARQ
jgi:hypothetical protein